MTTISDDELSQTPLHALGRRLGAQFMPVAGYANNAPSALVSSPSSIDGVLAKFVDWLNCKDACEAASAVPRTGQESLLGYERELPGHGGEPNSYVLRRRGRICLFR